MSGGRETLRQLARLTEHCHHLGVHPDYQYCTTYNGQQPSDEGWERNTAMGKGEKHKAYWRRRKPTGAKA